MVVGACEGHVGGFVHVQRRRDVDKAQARHALRMVQRQAMRDPRAAVVCGDEEAFVAESVHQRRHVGGHAALAVVRMIGVAWRLARVAVAAQIRKYEPEVRREPLRDALPHRMRLREPVQQQQRRRVDPAADAREHAYAIDVVERGFEAVEPGTFICHRGGSCAGLGRTPIPALQRSPIPAAGSCAAPLRTLFSMRRPTSASMLFQ